MNAAGWAIFVIATVGIVGFGVLLGLAVVRIPKDRYRPSIIAVATSLPAVIALGSYIGFIILLFFATGYWP